MITVKINDKDVSLPNGATLQDALEQQGITAQGIATALNGTVVPSALRQSTILHNGDSIIIIKAFYGG
ncbi:MAG: sulfur carrier protein ThiS [Muribaculaceae bacterium]|nr:sulfur carrier protein ThiS [Muribaculaceae bacterium]